MNSLAFVWLIQLVGMNQQYYKVHFFFQHLVYLVNKYLDENVS